MITLKLREGGDIASFLGGDLYYGSKIPEEQLKSFQRLIVDFYLPKLETILHKNEPDIVQEALQNELFGNFQAVKLSHYEKDTLESGYKQNYFDKKVQGEVDFVIKTNNIITALFEAKKPTNAEMISAQNPNTTALHEAILYYLREKERCSEQNERFEMRHIVITDFYQFFFFKEIEFERCFYKDDFIKSLYDRHKSLIKSDLTQESKRNIEFYADLKNHLATKDFTLTPLYLDLRQIVDCKDLSEIKPFVKAFSPEFLLSTYIHKNEINEAFYKELLYILGLKVLDGSKDKNKNTIIPNNVSGTLYHNIVDSLPNECDKTQENIISLIILWLNRILFLKLIEANLVRFASTQQDKSKTRFLNTEKIKDFYTLNELFFKIFAIPHAERDTASPFYPLPYLNSSLFSPNKLEQRLIGISDLSSYKKLSPYKKVKSKPQTQIPLLEYLLRFLDRYDFGSGEEYETDTLISASVLGNVFERINAYKDGSFYTPSEITAYMCKENLQKVVLQKFNEINPKWQCKNLSDIEYEINREIRQSRSLSQDSQDRQSIIAKHIATLKSIKICDPAVGSGHFLVSALNEMIKIHYDLGLLSKHILRNDLQIIGDEVYINNFVYSRPVGDMDIKHKIQKELFALKKSIIENNLFGVDINPNSVEICKLRLWIELLKNSYYLMQGDEGYEPTLSAHCHQMQTLPNIDINIKCGNSLISNIVLDITKDKLEQQLKNLLQSTPLFSSSKTNQTLVFGDEIKAILNDLKNKLPRQIESYKNATNAYKNETNEDLRGLHKREIESAKDFILSLFVKTNPAYREFKILFAEYLKTYGYSGIYNAKIPNNSIQKEQEKLKKYIDDFNYNEMLDIPTDECGFAKEDFMALVESMNVYEKIKSEAKLYFEWRFEFPELLDKNGDFMGFDLVIGNPPYGDLLDSAQKDFCQNKKLPKEQWKYQYADTGDIYKLFIEKGFDLIKKNGNLSYIVPLSVTSSKSNIALHKMLLDNCEWIEVSSYGHRPVKIFHNAEQRLSIISFLKTNSKCKKLMTTKLNKRYANQTLDNLINNMDFIDSLDFVQEGAICKIGLSIENSIMRKIYAQKQSLKSLMKGKERIYYRTSGGGYYDLYTSYSTQSSKENYFDAKNAKLLVALMSSNLFWWFKTAYSNGRDSYIYEFERFHIPKFSKTIIAKLETLATKYEADIEKNHDFSNGVKTYKIRKSKHIIDEIDRLICPLYGLSDEEMDFIINYEIEFRTD